MDVVYNRIFRRQRDDTRTGKDRKTKDSGTDKVKAHVRIKTNHRSQQFFQSRQRITIKDLYEKCPRGTKVVLAGTVQEVREKHRSSSLVVTDGSTIKSVTINLTGASSISKGTIVQVSGTWRGRQLAVSVDDTNVESSSEATIDSAEAIIIGDVDPTSYPLNKENTSPETLREMPHLRIRLPYFALLARFRSAVVSALTSFFDTHPGGPFYQVHLPIITWTDCEGGAEVFSIFNQTSKREGSRENDIFFGGRRYLTVTAALHGEPFVQGLGRIWTLAPCFRAEISHDERHLAEFWMLEVALDHITELETLLNLMETMIKDLITQLRRSAVGKEMLEHSERHDLQERWDLLSRTPYPRITVKDAVDMLQQAQSNGRAHFSTPPEHGADVKEEHELYLVKTFQSPVFLTHFYTNTRLFTALQSSPLDPSTSSKTTTTESFDLLLPDIGELCSGGLREHRLDVLLQVMRRKNFFKNSAPAADCPTYPFLQSDESLRSLEWFADLRRWGTTPHGGYGIGFERLLMYLTGATSVKDCISFPRYLGVCGS